MAFAKLADKLQYLRGFFTAKTEDSMNVFLAQRKKKTLSEWLSLCDYSGAWSLSPCYSLLLMGKENMNPQCSDGF